MTDALNPSFRFAEHFDVVIPGEDESEWKRASIDSPVPVPAGKFIYAFQKLGDAIELYAEFEVGSDGNLSALQGRDRLILDVNEAPLTKTNSPQASLPTSVNGKQAFYCFLAFRRRLRTDAIVAILDDFPKFPDFVDLAREASFFEGAVETEDSTQTGLFVGVVEPMTLAFSLHDSFERAANDVLNYTTEFKGQSNANRLKLRINHKTLLIAKLLKAVGEEDGDLKTQIGDVVTGGFERVAQYVTNHEAKLETLMRERNRRGLKLCLFLRSTLWKAMDEAHQVDEANDYPDILAALGKAMGRLCECPAGRMHYSKLVDDPPRFISKYVLPESELSEGDFQVARKSGDMVLKLWEAFGIAKHKKKADGLQKWVLAFKFITRKELLSIQTVTETFAFRPGVNVVRESVQVTKVTVTQVSELRIRIQEYLPPFKASKAFEVAEEVAAGVEAINLFLALNTIVNTTGQTALKDAFNLIGSTLDAVSAFEGLLNLSKRTVKIVGILSAAIDAGLAVVDANDAYNESDLSKAVGFGLVAGGSALTMIGLGVSLAAGGAATAGTGVGFAPGAILCVVGSVTVALGWFVAVFTDDSDLQTFAKHCVFGKPEFKSAKGKPPWADDAFNTWTNDDPGLTRQVRSLFNLLAAFTQERDFDSQVTLTPGLLLGGSTFLVECDIEGIGLKDLTVRKKFKYRIDVRARIVQQDGGDPPDLSQVRFLELNGRPQVQVQFDPAPGSAPQFSFLQTSVADVRTRLDLAGDGSIMVPIAPKVVNTKLGSDKVSSKEVV